MADAVDRVELKAVVSPGQHRGVLALMRAAYDREDRARFGRVYFFDTPDLGLRARGMLIRARSRRGGGDVVVKLRRPVFAVPEVRWPRSGARVELDVLPGAAWHSVSLRHRVGLPVIERAVSGQAPLLTLLSLEQQALFHEHANTLAAPVGAMRIETADLVGAGPVEVTRACVSLPGLPGG